MLDAHDVVGDFPTANKRSTKRSTSEPFAKSNTHVAAEEKYQIYLDKLLQAYQDIEPGIIYKLYDIFKWDFLMFGYEVEPFYKNPYYIHAK